jgi:ABC-type uncharacterized transport system ATPase subunit
MNLNEAKDVASKLLDNAQIILERDHGLHPVLFAVNKDADQAITPVMVRIKSEEDRCHLRDLMKDMSEASMALILLQDAYLKWVDEPTEHIDKEDEDAYTALIATIFTPQGSSIKQIIYYKHGDSYSFCTEDWVDYNPTKGVLQNPFIK